MKTREINTRKFKCTAQCNTNRHVGMMDGMPENIIALLGHGKAVHVCKRLFFVINSITVQSKEAARAALEKL